ncbi:MAG: uracil phosphoribosyltransferase [Candidatus Melainabacteria bacterium]|nr:uracil phosphoribosyltransferase [Candidatus Melainabacteria bacterium]MBI3309167.1 uracil phosphoribosyltransferase [Candidatus Melainabacteria bacterium]
MSVIKSSNILTENWLSTARDKNTTPEQFRVAVENIGMILFSEAISNGKVKSLISKRSVKTPLKKTQGLFIDQKHIYLVPILRAGLGMLPGVKSMVPMSKVAHVGLYRNEKTLQPHWYLDKLPRKVSKKTTFFVLEPMLATGGTITTVLQRMIALGARNIFVLSVLIAKDTMDVLAKKFPIVNFYVAGVDPTLNSKGYIVPGLGDAGDRAFNL